MMINTTAPKVSICIPVYNSAAFLGAAVESALAQAFDSFEILIIDDCSSDGSADIASQYAAQSPLIRFIANKKNIGMVANWNLCLVLAKGKYIKFLFSDDLLTATDNIHRLATILDQHPEVALACSYRRIINCHDTTLAEKGFEPSGLVVAGSKAVEKCLRAGVNYIGEPSVVMFRKDDASRGFIDSYRQLVDLEMWLHLLLHGGIWCEQEALAAFRRHPGQQTTGNVKARIHLDEQLRLYDTYFKCDIISLSNASKAVLYYIQCYQVWKSYAKDMIMSRKEAENIIGKYFPLSIFKSLTPLYKLLNPLRKAMLRLSEKRDLKRSRLTKTNGAGCTLEPNNRQNLTDRRALNMNFRFFAKTFYILLILFITLNALIWFSWVKDIVDPKRKVGDLMRLGYLQGFTTPAMQSPLLLTHHIEAKDYNGQKIDMVNIGDSFSLDSFGCYQDQLASRFNISILNIPTQMDSSYHPVTILVRMINSGYLDRIKPRYLLLQSVEREATKRLSNDFNLSKTATISELESEFSNRVKTKLQSDELADQTSDFNLKFINNGNWKFVANNIQYLFRDKAFKSKVIKSKLDRHFFSSAKGDVLLFYRDDYTAARKTNTQTMVTVNDNLNILADLLKAKGISLIFMPAPDKLTLYGPYLKRKNYPKSIFFEELRKLPKRYTFIDTKEILSKELSAGVKDLYYQGDTHWSRKAPEAIAKSFTLP